VPFDSDYKFMATFHRRPAEGEERLIELVKGGPDVVLARCTSEAADRRGLSCPDGPRRPGHRGGQREMGEKGLRVLAFAYRLRPGPAGEPRPWRPTRCRRSTRPDFVGMVGIIDPLRPSAVEAVRTPGRAGIDVRMITGDHAITASAIGAELGLGPGAISGASSPR
jgi:P-type Ca2+ transporter type 2C